MWTPNLNTGFVTVTYLEYELLVIQSFFSMIFGKTKSFIFIIFTHISHV